MNSDELNGENVQNRLILNLKISQFFNLVPSLLSHSYLQGVVHFSQLHVFVQKAS